MPAIQTGYALGNVQKGPAPSSHTHRAPTPQSAGPSNAQPGPNIAQPAASASVSHTAQPAPSNVQAGPASHSAAGHPIANFFLRTWRGNILAVLGLILAVLGAVWSIYTGVLNSRYGALQSCAALYSIGKYSSYCNNTLDRGVMPAPKSRRHLTNVWDASSAGNGSWASHTSLVANLEQSLDARHALARWVMDNIPDSDEARTAVPVTRRSVSIFSATIVVMFTAGLLAFVYTRPRLRPFPPVVSSVRMVPFLSISITGIGRRYVMLAETAAVVLQECGLQVAIAYDQERHPEAQAADVATLATEDVPCDESTANQPDQDPDDGDWCHGCLPNDEASLSRSVSRSSSSHEDRARGSTSEDTLSVLSLEALLAAQEKAFRDYCHQWRPVSEDHQSSNGHSDADSELLPKVQRVLSNHISYMDVEQDEHIEPYGSKRHARPELWLLTSTVDLEPNNPHYTEPTPAAPTEASTPLALIDISSRPSKAQIKKRPSRPPLRRTKGLHEIRLVPDETGTSVSFAGTAASEASPQSQAPKWQAPSRTTRAMKASEARQSRLNFFG